MWRSPDGLRSAAKRRLTTACVFFVLGAIGFWGHRTGWSFAASSDAQSHATTTAPRHYALKPVSGGKGGQSDLSAAPIRLASREVVEQMGIQTIAAESRSLYRELSVTARVAYDPSRIARLSARVPGTVWRVEKHPGQAIRRGEVLAVVDSMQVGRAKAELLHALADVSLKQRVADRMHNLASGEVPKRLIDQADVDLRQARFALFNNQQALINLGLPIHLDALEGQSDEALLRHVKFLGLPQQIVDALDPATATANLLPILAPFDGLVVGEDAARGELVDSNDNRFEIADVGHMLIRLSVPDEEGQDLRLGQQVVFSAGHARVTTSISWISTEIDPKTRTIEVRCNTVNPRLLDERGEPTDQYLLRANLFGTALVRVEERPAAVVVPTKAVQSSGSQHYVFVETDATDFEARRVDVGIATDEVTELVHGLRAGERVASEGSHVLKSEAIRQQDDGGA